MTGGNSDGLGTKDQDTAAELPTIAVEHKGDGGDGTPARDSRCLCMVRSREYRQFAMDCLRWAEQASDPSRRQILRDTASQWTAIADAIDRDAPLIEDETAFRARMKRLMD